MSNQFDRVPEIDDILAKYANMVYRLALFQTKNKADADDIFQEVFVRYISHRKPFASEEHQKAWLITVTINCSRKLFSSAWFRRTVPLPDSLQFNTKEKGDVFEAVLELPRKYRTVIHLFYYEDYSVNQIASLLSSRETTVKSQLFRARKMLKDKLKEEFDHD
ncbi:MAG: sigma-70 family RNA polymerase sigma factor [Gorillibacterium sp.]|nr:sigma-70 family RNA polymerase sigma factor [Gorillibacterium sp.]